MDRIGGESLAVAQNTYAVNWFKGKELNLVFGLQLSMARLVKQNKTPIFFTSAQVMFRSSSMCECIHSRDLQGSTVNMNIMGWVYSKVTLLLGAAGHTALGCSFMIGKVTK